MMKSIKTALVKKAAVMALAGFVGTISSASVVAGEHATGMDWETQNWVKRGPVQIVMLWGDSKGESAFFLKIKAGKRGAKHAHNEDYHGETLQGTWLKTMGDDSVTMLPVGSHIMQPKKEWHIDGCAGPEDCILLIHFEGPRDVIFPED